MSVWNIRSIYEKLHFDDILLIDRLSRKSTSKKKFFQKIYQQEKFFPENLPARKNFSRKSTSKKKKIFFPENLPARKIFPENLPARKKNFFQKIYQQENFFPENLPARKNVK